MELQKVPFLKLLSVFTSGVLLAYHYDLSIGLAKYFTGISIVTIALLFLSTHIFKRQRHTVLSIKSLTIYIACFSIGLCRTIYHSEIISPQHFSNHHKNVVLAKIISEPDQDNRTIKFIAEIQEVYSDRWIETVGKVRFTLLTDSIKPDLNYGDVFITTSKIIPVTEPLNPGEFDAKKWLKSKNIYHTSFANTSNFFPTSINQGNKLIAYSYELRKKQVEKYRNLIKDTVAYSIASTLIFGFRSDLSQEVLQSFSSTGTIHALSVSGAHVAILFLFIHHLLFFLRNNLKLLICKLILILIILWTYALITGFSPSVLRSVIMISLYIGATYLNKRQNSLNIMAFSALALILYHPPYVADIGFQLSYFAVVGLILIQPILQNLLQTKNSWVEKLWSYCAMSFAAQIATLPLSIYYFHQFPVYFLIGNLFILFPLNLIMGLGALAIIPYLEILAIPLEFCIQFTYRGLYWISQFPLSLISNIHFTPAHVFLLSCVIILFFSGLSLKLKSPILLSIVLTILVQIDLTLNKFKTKDKLILYSLKNEFGFSVETKGKLEIYSSISENHSTYKYSIDPSTRYPTIRRSTHNTLSIHSDAKEHDFYEFKFKGFKILLVDKCIRNRILPQDYDLVLFIGYSNINMEELKALRRFNRKVIFTHPLPKSLDMELDINRIEAPYVLMNQKHVQISL